MSGANRIGWGVVFFAIAINLGFVLASKRAHPAELTLAERVTAVQHSLRSRKEPSVEPPALTAALLGATQSRDWIALLLTVAHHEAALSERIARGECRLKIGECDAGKAWGLWQMHRNDHTREVWGSVDLDVQAKAAARMLKRMFYKCQSGPLRADWVARTLSAYAGLRCEAQWPGLAPRVATFQRVRSRL
jgi:hypothetical protein